MKKETIERSVKKVSENEEERLSILAKADEVKGEQLVLTNDGIKSENELKKFALGSVDDPERKYELYYKGIMRLLRKYLPKGKKNQKARAFIYEEKNTLLTRGHRINVAGFRGADSRMAYIQEIEDALNIITQWIVSKGTTLELYNTMRDLNEAKGYGTPKH